MSCQVKIKKRALRRARVVRAKIRRNSDLPRVSVFRSLNQIYAQLIDDAQHKTLVSASSMKMATSGSKTEQARAVGMELARVALERGVSKAVFDRGRFLYHGRVKALAEGLREGGLQI